MMVNFTSTKSAKKVVVINEMINMIKFQPPTVSKLITSFKTKKIKEQNSQNIRQILS
jgi:hypothetical protein